VDSEEPSAVGAGPQDAWSHRQQGHGRSTAQKKGYSLKGNRKRFTGPPHPDRDTQFEYLGKQKQAFLDAGEPVVSVDTKKKELIGNFKNAGRTWCTVPEDVNTHDFPSDAKCRAVPYGVYDLAKNRGFVTIGTSADTPEFAVDSLARWWREDGTKRYPDATRLLILADTGGSNSARSRVFKQRIQEKVADSYGLTVTICHYPAGASKWNPVEHRLFSFVSMNWAGEPLRTLKGMAARIRGTVTDAGLRIRAAVTRKTYPKGVTVSDDEMDQLQLQRHRVCPDWNYTISPR